MIRALVVFAVIGVVLFAGNWLLDHPGNVSIVLPGFFEIEWTFAWAMTVLAIVLVALIAGLAVLYLLVAAPWRLSRHFERRRNEKGQQAIAHGMVAVAAGDRQEAKKQAQRATALLPDQPMTTLLAAQSAQMSGDTEAAQQFFRQLADKPEGAFLGLRGLWMQAMKDGRTRDALHYAELAHDQQPNSVWVLDSLFELQTRLGQWEEAHKTLAALGKAKAHDKEQFGRESALVDIERSRAAASKGDTAAALQTALSAYKNLPDFLPAAAQLALAHIANGRRGKAEKVLEDAWTKEPHPMLADAYKGVVDQVGVEKQLSLASKLADRRPDHPESRVLIAHYSMAADQWAEARKAIEPLTRRDPDARICRLMAEIEMHGFNDADAAREWLARSAAATPESAWVCNETGAVQAEWSAVCNESKRFGTLEWRVPNHLVPALPSVLDAPQPATASRDLALATEAAAPAAAASAAGEPKAPVVFDAVAEPVEAVEVPATGDATNAGKVGDSETKEPGLKAAS